MGAWGSGPFDNDDAADFSEDFDDASAADRPELIRAALQDVVGVVDYLDGDAANVAIAAAAIIASQRAGGQPVDTAYGPTSLSGEGDAVLADFASLAVQALDRIVGDDSEWRELWEEGGEADEALEVVAGVRARLLGRPAQ